MVSNRLREARLAAGLTQEEVVAQLAGHGVRLTKAGLSKYERGGSVPPASLLLRLGQVLGVSTDFFFREVTTTVEWCAFRKLSRLGDRRQERVKVLAQQVVERMVWLQQTLYPQSKPAFTSPMRVQSPAEAEAAATALRKKWKLGDVPIESVIETLEDKGCIVVEYPHEEDQFHGLSGWANDIYPVAVTASAGANDRRRFNLAHELGHLVMNCDGVAEKEEEKLAHRFAAAFIVPASVAIHELGSKRRRLSFQELGLLKQKHGLSMQAWLFRARDLDIITDGHFRSLFTQFSARGWRKQEPVDYPGEGHPIRLKQLTIRALAEGIITSDKAEELCPGCTKDEPAAKAPLGYVSAADLMMLPAEEREALLADAAKLAQDEYETTPDLTDFEAYGEEDLRDETPPDDE